MEQILLAVFFLINNKPTLIDGWWPLIQPSMEVCNQRKLILEEQLKHMSADAIAFCGTEQEIQQQLDILNSIDT